MSVTKSHLVNGIKRRNGRITCLKVQLSISLRKLFRMKRDLLVGIKTHYFNHDLLLQTVPFDLYLIL